MNDLVQQNNIYPQVPSPQVPSTGPSISYPPPTPLDTVPLDTVPNQKSKGQFEYIQTENTRQMLMNCWEAITLTEMWNFMKKDPGSNGYMFSNARELKIITKKMNELPNNVGHSGFTMGWTLRQMQFIALHGEDEYKKQYLQSE